MKLPIPFPNHRSYKGHSGVDFGQPRGTPIPASGPGKVLTLGKNTRGGYYIWVQYDNGPIVGYHHMDSHKGCPKAGTRISEGTRLGYVGSLGKFSTGPHLHSEVRFHATTTGYWKYFDANRVVGAKQAGSNGTPLTPEPDETELPDMTEIKYYHSAANPKTGKVEYGIFGHQLPGGCRMSTNTGTGATWGKLYGQPDGNSWGALTWDQWIRLQAEAKVLNAEWVAQQRAISGTTVSIDTAPIMAELSTLRDGIETVNANIDDQPTHFEIHPK